MTQPRVSRGIRSIGGGDVAIRNLTLKIGDDGGVSPEEPPTVELRSDMWPSWLEEAIDAAVLACNFAAEIPALVEQLESAEDPPSIERDIDRFVISELKASMRAITASAFAIDAWYTSIKERSPKHPDQDKWTQKRTARHMQVTETFRYHLRIKKAASVEQMKRRVSEVFRFRDWAAHPGAKFRQPEYRDDLNVALDWHYVAFRRENAVGATALTVSLLDSLVEALNRGSDELATMKQYARRRMDEILDIYEALDGFPPIGRAEPSVTTETTPPSPQASGP